MKNVKRSFAIVLVLALMLISATAFAASVSYNTTLPVLFDKTIVDGTRSSSQNAWSISLSSTAEAASFTGWLDGKISGSWQRATNDFTLYRGDNKNYSWGVFIPISGTEVRLRANSSGYGGQNINGTIDFK